MSTIPRLGRLQPGERFPTEAEEAQCVEVTCPTCKSTGLGLPGSTVRCPSCATKSVVPGRYYPFRVLP